ncbi:HNH/ENDO VII family nuclease [Helicobacter suis]|uniref:HNH/ENDO VII family nuclease n=1 Tax=Helicobacter suis TaxID=104628 RepID=UPI001F075C48|nr:HNH/ENDO VII family nuclease [Helicobacter suis]
MDWEKLGWLALEKIVDRVSTKAGEYLGERVFGSKDDNTVNRVSKYSEHTNQYIQINDLNALNRSAVAIYDTASQSAETLNSIFSSFINLAMQNALQEQAHARELLEQAREEKQKRAQIMQECASALAMARNALATCDPEKDDVTDLENDVASCEADLRAAEESLERASHNYANMQRKLELSTQAVQILSQLQTQLSYIGHACQNKIAIFAQMACATLAKVQEIVSAYQNASSKGVQVPASRLYLSMDYASLNKCGLNLNHYNSVEKKFLQESHFVVVRGKIVAQRSHVFDPNFKDGAGHTNIERMQRGNAPIAKDRKVLELHHLRQEEDGIIIELTSSEHRGHYKDLHDDKKPSEIDRKAWNQWRREYYKERAKDEA